MDGRYESREERKETGAQLFSDAPITTSVVGRRFLAPDSAAHGLDMFVKMNIDPKWPHLPSRGGGLRAVEFSRRTKLEDPRAALRYYAGEQNRESGRRAEAHGSRGDRSSLPKFQNRARKVRGGCGDSR